MASILFVWWQSKKATANQQTQLDKLNEQLGLEKKHLFREEFQRLFLKAIIEADKEVCAGPNYSEIFRKNKHTRNCSQRELSISIKPDGLGRSPMSWSVSDQVLEQGWKCLRGYLMYVFEIADLLSNRASEYGLTEKQLEPFFRQFNYEFYTGKKYDLEFIKALVPKSEIHGYQDIERVFAR